MAMKENRNLKSLIVTFLFLLISVLTVSQEAYPANWSWDQNHDCVETKKGSGNWGRWDYDGKFTKDTYSSKECCELLCKICPVYANTGRYQKTYTDLTVPGVGPTLIIKRTYNSQEWSSSLMGYSWTFNFGRKLIITRTKDGEKRIGVLLQTGEKNYYREDLDGTLTRITEFGATYELINNGNNTYTIRQNDGTLYELREDGKIAKIIDKNENELVFTYNSVGCLSRITNASGNYVDFQLGANGKVASVSDNLGRTVTYGYDDNGNLTSVTDPLGNTTQYVYNTDNFLTQIIDARGNVVETATYDNHEPPRVSTFTEKGETYTIAYFDGRTEKTDSQGNTWTIYFNDVGVIQRVVDPLGNVKQQQLNKVTSTSVDWEEDLNGNRTTYTYDADGNIASERDSLGNTWIYTYIAGTNLLETETDPLGVITRYEYDAYGNQKKVTRDFGGPLENTTSYTYDSQGNLTSITDPLGNATVYEYDSVGNLTRETDPVGNVTTFTYDSRGNKLTETDALGNTTTYTYDAIGQVLSVTNALGNITTYTYDSSGNRISETDANGNTTTFSYDPYNRMIEKTDPLGNTTSYAYDSRDNLISKTDPNGNTRTYTYDILNRKTRDVISGRKTRETDPLGGQTTYTYDAEGNLLTATDPNGMTTTFTYDANYRLISETNGAGETTNYSYDPIGNLISKVYPNGNTVSRTFDSLGHLVAVSDTLGSVIGYTYDMVWRLLTENDALGNTISYSYDPNGRTIRKTDAMGNNTNYSYDVVGNLLSITDREGNTTSYSYDALGQRFSETDQLGNTTVFSYDNVGNVVSVTDANGNTTSYVYDSANRLLQTAYSDGSTRSFSYDASGNVISRTDQNGNVTAHIYDALNRIIEVDYPGQNDNEYVYDGVGNILTASNQNATMSFVYDNAYRLTQSVQNGQMVGYSYDIPNGSRTLTYPSGKTVKELRNPRGLLAQVENSSSQAIVQYNYDSGNRLMAKNYLNGVAGNYYYDANGRITELNYSDGGSQIILFQYGFDKEGNRLYANKLHDTSNSEQYVYDAKYRLIQFSRGTSQTSYSLDALSNWTSKTTDGVSEDRTHNVMNEIISVGGISYDYDDNGNLIDDGTNTYEYDYDNRLVKVTAKSDGTVLAKYKYDAFGRRIEKQHSSVISTYFYDVNRVIEEHVDGAVESVFVYGASIDEPVSIERDGQSYYYHTNALGSVVALTNGSGVIAEKYTYEAYGKPTIYDPSGSILSNSALSNPYLFTGRLWDTEVNLYYYRFRTYDPQKGRFLSRDPIGYQEGMNLYEYVRSNPIMFIDPMGLYVAPDFYCCTKGEERKIKSALAAAETMSKKAYNYLKNLSHPFDTKSTRYKTWFGKDDKGWWWFFWRYRGDTVKKNFREIWETHKGKKIRFDCTKQGCKPTWGAYVYKGGKLEVFLCNMFWHFSARPGSGSYSQGGIILHEISHEVAGTDDHAYGDSKCKSLAKTDPDDAVDNADSYRIFARESY